LENTVEDWEVDLSGAGEKPQTSAQTLHVALAIPESEAEEMIEENAQGGS
jgi:5-oxopent-3-ene-1,2,5-tricarboxylate decarboxylase/2-hydroxyhepta-2,4-diene-1,7-dioate isomerase